MGGMRQGAQSPYVLYFRAATISLLIDKQNK